MPQQPTVWVANKGYHRYEGAEGFGKVVTLTEGRVNIFRMDNLQRDIEDKLKDATAEDYLLVSGNAIPTTIASHYLLKRFGMVRLLVWAANERKYTALTLRD